VALGCSLDDEAGDLVDQLFQIAGALMILAAYAAAQFRLLDSKAITYLLLNVAGSAILARLAYVDREWGFLLLEGCWALISAWGLLVQLRRSFRPPGSTRL
jgi:hypothetical protein